jgi:hypothetical protein
MPRRRAAAPPRRLPVGLRVAALVGHHRPRRGVGADAGQGLEPAAAAGLAASQVEIQRQAAEAALQVDLGRESAARAAERLVLMPPGAPAAETCARTAVLPSSCTRRAVRLSATGAWKKASEVPVRPGRQNRSQTPFQLPNSAGSARRVRLWTAKRCSASGKRRSSRPLPPRRERAARGTPPARRPSPPRSSVSAWSVASKPTRHESPISRPGNPAGIQPRGIRPHGLDALTCRAEVHRGRPDGRARKWAFAMDRGSASAAGNELGSREEFRSCVLSMSCQHRGPAPPGIATARKNRSLSRAWIGLDWRAREDSNP